MDPQPDYTAAWRDYRKRRLIFWTVALAYAPGVTAITICVGLPLSALSGIKPDYFFFFIGGSWMLAMVVAGWRIVLFPCPRCGKWFSSTLLYRNPFTTKCLHCGLEKWAISDMTLRVPPHAI
jgi:hypothetical protein